MMSEAPTDTKHAEWIKVAFGDVVRLSKKATKDPESEGFERYIGLEHIKPGDLRIRDWGVIADGTSFTRVFRPGQVLFGKRRAYLRKVAVPDFSGVCSGDIYVLEPNSERLISELLPFICQTDAFFDHAIGTSAGSLSPRTKWEDLEDYRFTLPPLSKQQELADLLNSSARVVATMQDLNASEVALRRSMLKHIGERCSRTSDQSLTKYLVGEILELVRTPIEPIATQEYREIGIRSFGRGVFHKDAVAGKEIGKKRVFSVEPGRLILNVVFAWEGAVAITDDSDCGFIASHRFPMFVPKRNDVCLRYLLQYFLSPQGLQLLGGASPGGAGRNRTLGQDRFFKQSIMLPSLEEQRVIADQLEAIDDAIKSSAIRAENAAKLHSSILAETLVSEVTCEL